MSSRGSGPGHAWRYFWAIIARNKFVIAAASLVWLLWRSGSQPRRLAYPCQQAAAANLGFLAVLFVPELARRHAARRRPLRPAFALATGTLALAAVLTLLVSAGVSVYSEWALTQMALSVPPGQNPTPDTVVAVHKTSKTVQSLTTADVEAMVRRAVADAGGLAGIVQPGHSVGIKPNLVNDNLWTASNPTGVTTDPRVVAALVKIAKEAGAATVTIVEGSAGPANWSGGNKGRDITWDAYAACGYDTNRDGWFDYDTTVRLIDLNDAGTGGLVPRPVTSTPPNTVLVTIPDGVIRTQYYVPKAILRPDQGGTCDVLISVPTLKNHSNGSVTLALKNRVGCAPSDIYHVTTYIPDHADQMKWDLVHWAVTGGPVGGTPPFPRDVTHSNPPAPSGTSQMVENLTVHYSIVDLNLVRPNDFAVVDGLVGITNGPTGTNKPSPYMNLIMAGRDSVAVDTIGTLIMGYNPMENLHISWAWNRGLGTRDTSKITVVGNNVAEVRRLFPNGYGGSITVETSPPWLSNVHPEDGDFVFGDVKVTANAGDNTGLARAELAIKLVGGPSLLVNGDFEQGSTGWTQWRAPWGAGEVWDFASTEPGHIGNACLRLKSGHASFGIYQEVAVTPGKTYKIDAYWKGKQLGPDGAHNWYEVLILDGPWDYGQADGNPNNPPFNNPSQPVFNEMYGYDSHTYAMTGDFGWEWTRDLNDTPIDTMDRDGLRTATGSVMTVVLKAGACCNATGSEGWFDELSLVEVGDETLVAVLPNPGNPFEIIWPSAEFQNGEYDLKLTVYDLALNQAGVTRSVYKMDIPGPLIALSTKELTASSWVGSDPPAAQFTVRNAGIDTLEYKIQVDQSWLRVEPATGNSTGEEDPIAVLFDVVGLKAGTYTASITVSDNNSLPDPARNSPQVIAVTLTLRTVRADFDKDGDVDMEDFGHMQACLSGFGITQSRPECLNARLDADDDVDTDDVNRFFSCFSGPGILTNPACE